MLVEFFFKLRAYRLSCSLPELLDLLSALEQGLIFANLDDFYHLAKVILVKDESQLDKFDRAFADYFSGVQSIDLFTEEIPEDWLRQQLQRYLTEEEKAQIKALGGLDTLLATLKQRLQEQQKRHQGGNKWIGTGGTSPFGSGGYNPAGVRIGQQGEGKRSAVKVWDQRQFKNLASDVELATRNIKIALRQLRKFARTGACDELDMAGTIAATAKNAGLLDLHLVPQRHNAVKVLMFFDVGGSMDAHIQACQELFSAVHSEFKYLEYFYFHNCVYEGVWKDNARRHQQSISVFDVMHKYGADYKLIFVGDATMGPYEITYPGGSVEHWNEEPGELWMRRLLNHFDHAIWLNPQHQGHWKYHASIRVMQGIMHQRMYPLTLQGLGEGIKTLSKRS